MSSRGHRDAERLHSNLSEGDIDDELRQSYFTLINSQGPVDTDAIRRLLLLRGLPNDGNSLDTPLFGRCSLRGLIWKALLGIGLIDTNEYANLVQSGPSVDDSRVREDARRTFAKSDDFNTRVPTDKIIRLLNAYIRWRGNVRGVYAQSMSLLAAPFLYIMPEPDAFHCFRALLDSKVGAYVQRYSGARSACVLLDRCIESLLPDLHAVLEKHQLYAEVYAFPVMSSLGMCVRPLYDTVRLWDIILAFGVHLHIVFTLARLALRGDHLVSIAHSTGTAPLSTRELEQGFGLSAEVVLAKGVALSAQIDSDLYSQLLAHSQSVGAPNTNQNSDLQQCSAKGITSQDSLDDLSGHHRINFSKPSIDSAKDLGALRVTTHGKFTNDDTIENSVRWKRSSHGSKGTNDLDHSQDSATNSSGSLELKRWGRRGIRASFGEVKQHGVQPPRP